MTKQQYSLKNFLRLAPNALLDRYFHERSLLTDLDIKSLDEMDIEPIYEAWLQLSDSVRPKTEEDFQTIDSVADAQGVVVILEEAKFHGYDFEPNFTQMPGFHHKALWTFLEHTDCLDVAAMFREADDRPRNYWKDRDGLVDLAPRDDKAACDELADVIKLYFRQKEGRGYACKVEVYRRGSRYYYFAYPEDHSRTLIEFQGQESRLERRIHRPVFQIIFVCDTEKGILSTYCEEKADVVSDLQELFARVVLVMHLPSLGRDERVYELNRLKDRNFKFRYDETSGIVDVRVKQLKFTIIGGGSQRITVDVNPINRDSLYDLLDEVLNTGNPGSLINSIPISMVNVNKVGLKAIFMPDMKRRKPSKTFYVSFPNSCSLGHDGRDIVLRKMLMDSGIEPKKVPVAAKSE